MLSASIGDVYGLLTIERILSNKRVLCKCACGKIKITKFLFITTQLVTSCGCQDNAIDSIDIEKPLVKKDEFIGSTFDRLTVVRVLNGTDVECKCECGTIKIVQKWNLVNGLTKSCGCIRKEKSKERALIRNKERIGKQNKLTRDLTGQRFGFLTVLERTENKSNTINWLVKCDCGTIKTVLGVSLKSGETISCGCYGKLNSSIVHTTHGNSKHPLWSTWSGMRRRCYNTSSVDYPNYGGRGIFICPEWNDDKTGFTKFIEDMGDKPDNAYSIDRINNDGPYSKDNCAWAIKKEQNKNRRNNRYLSFNGETLTAAEWAEKTGLKSHTILARIDKLGWSVERALTTLSQREINIVS